MLVPQLAQHRRRAQLVPITLDTKFFDRFYAGFGGREYIYVKSRELVKSMMPMLTFSLEIVPAQHEKNRASASFHYSIAVRWIPRAYNESQHYDKEVH